MNGKYPDLKRIFWAALFFLILIRPADAAMDYFKVLDISGNVEIRRTPTSVWMPVRSGDLLTPRMQVRTSEGSWAEFSFSGDLSELARLDSLSEMEVAPGPTPSIKLKRGSFMMLREKDEVDPTAYKRDIKAFEVFVGSKKIRAERSGFQVSADRGRSWIRVFSDKVWVIDYIYLKEKEKTPRIVGVSEGFKLPLEYLSGIEKKPVPDRMIFSDYSDWQTWVRRCYERKDDRQADLLEKDGVTR